MAGLAGVLEGVGAEHSDVRWGDYAWDLESGRPPEHFGLPRLGQNFSPGYLVLGLNNVAVVKTLRWRDSSPLLGVNCSA